jgi:hypothetical protein
MGIAFEVSLRSDPVQLPDSATGQVPPLTPVSSRTTWQIVKERAQNGPVGHQRCPEAAAGGPGARRDDAAAAGGPRRWLDSRPGSWPWPIPWSHLRPSSPGGATDRRLLLTALACQEDLKGVCPHGASRQSRPYHLPGWGRRISNLLNISGGFLLEKSFLQSQGSP